MTHFKNYKPFMAYLTQTDIDKLKKFSKANNLPMAQLIREAIHMRMAGENPQIDGFNQGLNKASEVISGMKMAQMRFPSGASFAEMISDELAKHIMRNKQPEEASDAKGRIIKESV